MSSLQIITPRSLAVTGGLLATGAAVVAEATPDAAVGTGSFLLGGAGLIAALSAFTKDYWSDRQKQREHEVALLRIKLRGCRTRSALLELYGWAKAARTADSTLPPVPALNLERDDELEEEIAPA